MTAHAARRRTRLTVVIDRSGSMEGLRGFVVEGVNQLLSDLDPDTVVTIVQFDDHDPFEVLVDGVPAAEVTPITADDYEPRGSTPLFDAVGRAVGRLAGACETDRVLGDPTRAVLAIVSDGCENASREFTGDQVRTLLEHHQAEGWTVQYLGLGNDAFSEAATIGLAGDAVVSLAYSQQGAAVAFSRIVDLTRAEAD